MVKTAPHFGHLTFVSFDAPAHPKEKNAKRINTKNKLRIFVHFFISGTPFLIIAFLR
jgi:hypothetical protein